MMWLDPTPMFRRIHGRYCGRGDAGGPPIDNTDYACFLHDVCYNNATNKAEQLECDRKLIKSCVALYKAGHLKLRQRLLLLGIAGFFQIKVWLRFSL